METTPWKSKEGLIQDLSDEFGINLDQATDSYNELGHQVTWAIVHNPFIVKSVISGIISRRDSDNEMQTLIALRDSSIFIPSVKSASDKKLASARRVLAKKQFIRLTCSDCEYFAGSMHLLCAPNPVGPDETGCSDKKVKVSVVD